MSFTSIAETRRSDEVRRLRHQVESLDREIARGPLDTQNQQSEYMADRVAFLTEERERIGAEISSLCDLDGDELILRFVPEAADVPPARLLPGTGIADRCGLPEGWVPGQVHSYN